MGSGEGGSCRIGLRDKGCQMGQVINGKVEIVTVLSEVELHFAVNIILP